MWFFFPSHQEFLVSLHGNRLWCFIFPSQCRTGDRSVSRRIFYHSLFFIILGANVGSDTNPTEIGLLFILGNTKCAQSLNKVSELVIRSHNFGTSPGHTNVFPASPVMSNPFHYHKPDKFGGRHRLVGQNANTFNLRLAVNAAGFCQRDKLMNRYLTTGNTDQRLKTLQLFLTEKSIIHDTQAILGEVLSIDR